MGTFRPYRWHDWLLFQRLAKQGISLDVEASLTRGEGTLRNSILASLPEDVGGRPTYLLRREDDSAIGQLSHHPGDPHARIAFAAPAPEDDNLPLWESLMESLTVAAGERGAVNLIAEVSEDSAAFEGLRHVGFAVYARQEIWRREATPVPDGATSKVRPCYPADEFNANVLYANVVPGLLRQIEPRPALAGAAYVLTEGDELVGLITAQSGSAGHLLEAYLHPAAEGRVDEAILGTLHHLDAHRNTVYFRVRRYQNWFGQRLAEHGFTLLGQQAMMVKHTAVRVEQHAFQPLPAFDGGIKASRPTPVTERFKAVVGVHTGHKEETDARLTLELESH